MAPSNLQALTRSHSAIASKKRAKSHQLHHLLFDEIARRDFLTGFHKRKLAKADAARKKALHRQRQHRLDTRRHVRRALRERAQQNAAQVESAYGAPPESERQHSADEEEWSGIDTREDEYGDEQTLATVTVIEDFDPELAIYGRQTSQNPPTKPRPSAPAPPHPHKKSKQKKVRYETNRARKVERQKQHTRKLEKAALAGAKSTRKNKNRASQR